MIAPVLLAAYVSATYRVDAASPFVMRVGQPCPRLADLLRQYSRTTAAFLTAWNPGSVPTEIDVNIGAQQRLMHEVTAMGYRWFEGVGKDASGVWPEEPSVLVIGPSRELARTIARTYGQNAFLWGELDAQGNVVPALVVVN